MSIEGIDKQGNGAEWEAGYRAAMLRAGKAMRIESYAAGYRAGIERAAKRIDDMRLALVRERLPPATDAECAAVIRALLDAPLSPSANADPNPDALPRPGEWPAGWVSRSVKFERDIAMHNGDTVTYDFAAMIATVNHEDGTEETVKIIRQDEPT